MTENANPQDGWQERAKNMDPTLKTIINGRGASFSTDFQGAMQFAKVVTAHYTQYFQKTEEVIKVI
jgi:hypothetical protein